MEGVYKNLADVDYHLSRAASIPVVGTIPALGKALMGVALLISGVAGGILGAPLALGGHRSLAKHSFTLVLQGGKTIYKGILESIPGVGTLHWDDKIIKERERFVPFNIETNLPSLTHTVTKEQNKIINEFMKIKEEIYEERVDIARRMQLARDSGDSDRLNQLINDDKDLIKEQHDLIQQFKRDNKSWYMNRTESWLNE